ncbi:MAG TPA: hypothetical protein VGB85_05080 [Nannocystis sp.]|jgi:hypothetical protein
MSIAAELAASPPSALAARMARLRWSDFGLDLASQLPRRLWSSHKLHFDRACEIGLFFLPRGERIPLHDHPHIHVWMRVLCGRLRATSFTWAARPLARRSGDAVLDAGSPVWAVLPEQDNLHELEALEDVAFLDVLRPPYIDGRVCTYYAAAPAHDDLWHMTALP